MYRLSNSFIHSIIYSFLTFFLHSSIFSFNRPLRILTCWDVRWPVRWPSQGQTYRLGNSLIHSIIYSFLPSFFHSFNLFSLTNHCIYSLVGMATDQCDDLLKDKRIDSLIHSFIQSFIPSFLSSFIHLLFFFNRPVRILTCWDGRWPERWPSQGQTYRLATAGWGRTDKRSDPLGHQICN